MLSARKLRVRSGERRRDDGEILRHVVGDAEGRQRAARHEKLLADLDDLDQLGRVRVEVDHVARFFRRLRARIHGDRDVGLGEGGRVVGAVAGHGDQPPAFLMLADQLELGFGRRFGEEVVHARFGGNRGGGQRIVAGDHDRLDAHLPQFGEALLHATFHDVLELDDAQHALPFDHDQRRRARAGDLVNHALHFRRELPALFDDVALDRSRQRPCGCSARPDRRRSCASAP